MIPEPQTTDDEVATWPEMIARLVEFGLPCSTAARLAGLPHVTPDVVDRWLCYCRLRGRNSRRGTNAFLRACLKSPPHDFSDRLSSPG